MATVIWVTVGGAIGSLARYGVAGAINAKGHPWGTVTVNVAGCLVLGVLVGIWGFRADTPQRLGVAIGLLGGFTTFSSFAIDTMYLWENGETVAAVASVLVSVLAGLTAAAVGIALGRVVSS